MREIIKKILSEHTINEIGTKRSSDTDVIYKGSDVVILVPKSFDSSKSFSRGTSWCTGGDCFPSVQLDDSHLGRNFSKFSEGGYILFRILFKDGSKIRLTINKEGKFSYGLGVKGREYVEFISNKNLNDAFDVSELNTHVNVQLSKKDCWTMFYNNYESPKFKKTFMSLSKEDKDEKRREYHNQYSMFEERCGTESYIKDDHLLLAELIKRIPKEGMDSMKKYVRE
jgi:hypothetical protein